MSQWLPKSNMHGQQNKFTIVNVTSQRAANDQQIENPIGADYVDDVGHGHLIC